MNGIEVNFKQWKCITSTGRYGNGRLAISLIDKKDYGAIATATVNVPSIEIEEGEIIVKEYSENSGMTEALIKAGIISVNFKTVLIGPYNSEVNVCKLVKR